MSVVDSARATEDEWLWGWDPTPGIVSVWAEPNGRAFVWRRSAETGALVREVVRFRPWLLLDRIDDLRHLGARFGAEHTPAARVTFRELDGTGALRFLVSADDGQALAAAVLAGASRRFGRPFRHLRELGRTHVLVLPPEEQYLVATGRTYFRDLSFDQLQRLQFDLETTGLDPRRDRIFLIAVRDPAGQTHVLEAEGTGDLAEAELVRRLVALVRAWDPDVIENHNLHGFDLPFLDQRARRLGVALSLGRIGTGLRTRAARRGVRLATLRDRSGRDDDDRRVRFVAPGRELIDTMDAVMRYGFVSGDLPGRGLKVVARHLGISGPERELIRGDRIYETYHTDPARVRRYAAADVDEVAALARMLGGAAFALARMAPRRYERLADAGAATGVIDPLLVRAYIRANTALPAHQPSDGTPHSGAALHLFAAGAARRIVKADVASLYPSLMRAYRISPARDPLRALLALVDRLVEHRLDAKARARAAPAGSAERYTHDATSNAMKLVVNSAYGYLAAGGELTRFADVHAANEVTRRGRATLDLMCRALAARGVTLLEADTDGVYFAVPEDWTEADERRVVSEVAAMLPPLVQLELEGRYQAMLSHEPKNYALLTYDGRLLLRGVAFRSSRAEPYGEAFLRRALQRLLVDDVVGVREVYLDTIQALRLREMPTREVSSRVRLTKTPAAYREVRDRRRELVYEALLAGGRTSWRTGDRVRVYRTMTGQPALAPELEEDGGGSRTGAPASSIGDGASNLVDAPGGTASSRGHAPAAASSRADATGTSPQASSPNDRRDYDVDHYVRLLRDTFAARLARAFTPEDFSWVFADPEQPSLFTPPLDAMRTVLTPMAGESVAPAGSYDA